MPEDMIARLEAILANKQSDVAMKMASRIEAIVSQAEKEIANEADGKKYLNKRLSEMTDDEIRSLDDDVLKKRMREVPKASCYNMCPAVRRLKSGCGKWVFERQRGKLVRFWEMPPPLGGT